MGTCVIEFYGQIFGWQVNNEYLYISLIRFSSSSRPYNSGLDVCIDCPEQDDCSKLIYAT